MYSRPSVAPWQPSPGPPLPPSIPLHPLELLDPVHECLDESRLRDCAKRLFGFIDSKRRRSCTVVLLLRMEPSSDFSVVSPRRVFRSSSNRFVPMNNRSSLECCISGEPHTWLRCAVAGHQHHLTPTLCLLLEKARPDPRSNDATTEA